MLDRFFGLSEHKTTVRTELLAGLTTFLTMAYIIFVQPMVLSGNMFKKALGEDFSTGMDFYSVTTATCVAAALASLMMGLYARYPIGQAPGMGENFFFVLNLLPAAGVVFATQIKAGVTSAWQIGLGVVFIAGVLFLLLSLLGVQQKLLEAISPSMRNGIAIGIGLFIAFIGLQNAGLVLKDPGTAVKMNPKFASPDLIVFFWGLLVTAGLHALRVRGSIVWGIVAATILAVVLQLGLPHLPEPISQSKLVTESMLMTPPDEGGFKIADRILSRPPSMAPTFFEMDLSGVMLGCIGPVVLVWNLLEWFGLPFASELSWSTPMFWSMVPFILIFLFMDVFDTLGTLIGVSEQAGLVKDDKLPRAKQALVSDAVGTVAGAAMGTSTVTSFIESASGVEQGGRTGLTAVAVGVLFLLALFFSPIIAMVGSYPPITAPALVVVGSLMMRNVTKIDWSDYTEVMPAFLIIIGIPLTYSIADGLALGFIAYPIIKLIAGQGREVKWLMYVMALVLVAYFLFVRVQVG